MMPGRPTSPPIADVDVRLLRVFRAVVECGGFSAAESELDLARSTVSTHIASLESRLDLRLCERGRGGFRLTDPGRLVYEEAVKLLAALDDFRTRVSAAHHRLVGELTIGVIDHVLTLPGIGLPDALGRFRDLAPEVHVSVRVLATDEIERGLASGRVHFGIYAPHRVRGDLRYREIASETQLLYCARGHPLFGAAPDAVTESEIEHHDFVGRSYLDEAKARDRPWRTAPAATANNLEAILILILSGRFIGLLPVQYAQPYEAAAEVRPVRPDIIRVRKAFSLVTWRTRSRSPVIEAFARVYDGQGDGRAGARPGDG